MIDKDLLVEFLREQLEYIAQCQYQSDSYTEQNRGKRMVLDGLVHGLMGGLFDMKGTYEFDVVVDVRSDTDDNIQAELSRLFRPLREQGVDMIVMTLHEDGGGWPTVRVVGDAEIIRDHMRAMGFDQESSKEFHELYRVRD